MQTVFEKFGGIRPMAAKLGTVPPSTVKSWHAKGHIPVWRHADILATAKRLQLSRHSGRSRRPDPRRAGTPREGVVSAALCVEARAEFRKPHANWTTWRGQGDCPVMLGAQVAILGRDGRVASGIAGEFAWTWFDHPDSWEPDDIIAYRVKATRSVAARWFMPEERKALRRMTPYHPTPSEAESLRREGA